MLCVLCYRHRMHVDQVVRKEKFLAEHPEWSIVFVRSGGYFEATRDEPNTVITDYQLRCLLDRVERATPPSYRPRRLRGS